MGMAREEVIKREERRGVETILGFIGKGKGLLRLDTGQSFRRAGVGQAWPLGTEY